MQKLYYSILYIFFLVLASSCGKDDSVTPLSIETNPDTISLRQNTEIEVFVFSNDFNIPSLGQLTASNPLKGLVQIIDSGNSPNNPSDDSILYTANPNQIGEDQFEYTICDNSGNCYTERVDITITSEISVAYNIEAMPYDTLSEYQFFVGDLKNLEPSFGVLPYALNASLFSDYAKKKRFIWMPNNVSASYVNDNVHLEFPIGTILIKNFYYNNVLPTNTTRIIETRLMIKKLEGWVFANYVWDGEQSEAFFDLSGSTVPLQWEENGTINSVDYEIPSGAKCFTCHKIMETAQPIGPKPRNLNLIYNYSDGAENQIDKLVSLGYLENTLPSSISKLPDYNNVSEPLELRVRSYLDINCAHCHSEETHCAYRPMRLDFSDTAIFSNMGLCVDPDTDIGEGLGHIIEPGDARNSVLHFRLSSIEPSTRMPLLGRTLMHAEGITLIEEWIDSLNMDCN